MKSFGKRLISLLMSVVCILSVFACSVFAKAPKVDKNGYVVNPTDYANMYKSTLKLSDFDFVDDNGQSITVNEYGEVNTQYSPGVVYSQYLSDGNSKQSSFKGYSNFVELKREEDTSICFAQGMETRLFHNLSSNLIKEPVNLKLRNGIKIGSTENEVVNAYGNKKQYFSAGYGNWTYEKGPWSFKKLKDEDYTGDVERIARCSTTDPVEYLTYVYYEPKSKNMSWKEYDKSVPECWCIDFYFDENKILCEIIAY